MDIDKNNNVNIGEFKIIRNPEDVVWTILGSCISVIFYVKKNLSLICHAQYPSPDKKIIDCSDSCPSPCLTNFPKEMKFKYVSCSLEYMIAYLNRKNINLNMINTSLVGGASALGFNKTTKTIGEQNLTKAKQILNKYKIRINREIIGGNEGYTLWYYAKNNRLTYKKHNSEKIIEV